MAVHSSYDPTGRGEYMPTPQTHLANPFGSGSLQGNAHPVRPYGAWRIYASMTVIPCHPVRELVTTWLCIARTTRQGVANICLHGGRTLLTHSGAGRCMAVHTPYDPSGRGGYVPPL